MKTFTSVVFMFVLILTNQMIAQQWWNVGTPGFSTGLVKYTSLAIDGNGTPYVAYADYGNLLKATVMKYNGSSWIVVGTPGFSAGEAGYTSLVIDGDGMPYVAYADNGNLAKATVMKYNGSSWVVVGTPGFSLGYAAYTSLAIDGNGTPYVAYMDWDNSYKATVMKYNGSSWVVVGSAGFSVGRADYTTLAIDVSGTPYVAYQDWGDLKKATVMKFSSSTGIEELNRITPNSYEVFQNYPNPFNPETKIRFKVAGTEFISLKIFDVLGNEISTLVNEEKPAGTYEVNFDGKGLSSGMYFYTLTAGNFIETKKMILMK
ncbi:MAG: T9SS type A sorting domain-containing protein [Ignavibacteriota bacterium]